MELLWRSKNDQENLFVRTSKSSFIQRALELLRKHFDEGVGREIAVDLYKNGDVSLWKASEIAHTNLEEFRDVLSRRGIKIKASGRKEESDKRLKEVFDHIKYG